MTPEERELRRALDARSGEASPQFRARMTSAFDEGRPASGLMQAVAVVAVVAITLGTVGVLLMSRNARHVSHGGIVSGARLNSPEPTQTPIYLPTTAQVSAPSRDVAWVLVASTVLFRSTDRGTTWEQRHLPPHQGGGGPPEISFVDAKNGWYFVGGVPETQCDGAGAQVWRTTDGAATWQLVAQVPWTQQQRNESGIAYKQCKESLSFIDPTHGFLGGGDPNHRPTIYRTSDGGKTWSASTLPDPPGFVSEAGGSGLRLRLIKGIGGTLLALADPGRSPDYVFRSTDGGATWAYVATGATWVNEQTPNRGLIYPAFVTASRWLVIGNNASGLETTDSGQTWHTFLTDYTDAAGVVSTFVFGDPSVGYGTVRGGLQRTVDGGSHWVRIATPGIDTPPPSPGSYFVRLSAPSSNVVWALVNNSFLFRSNDRGNSWEQRSLPALRNMRAAELSFVDDRQGWLFQDCDWAGTHIWQTKDGGVTWLPVVVGKWTVSSNSDNVGSDPCKDGLSFIDPMRGFIAASVSDRHPTIYRTVDGGKNWAGVDLPDPPDFKTGPRYSLRAGVVKKLGSAMYVQASGMQPGDSPDRSYIFRSVDAGATWSWMTKVPPTSVVLMVTESRWLTLYAPGFSMESTNSGQQWHPYESDFNAGATRVVFADSQVGFATTQGALLRTADGGLGWERISSPGFPKLNLLPVTDPGFKCRLPVVASLAVNPLVGGFVPVPGGSFQSDPAAGLVLVDRGLGLVQTSAQPSLKGTYQLSFDAPFSRWVPARPEVFSPDGAQYAWSGSEAISSAASPARTEWTTRLHLTSVADGSDRSFAVGGAGPIAFTKDGVLLTYGDEHQSTVWRLNPATGSLTKLSDQSFPTGSSGGAVWLEPLRGPNPVGSAHTGDTLTRLDLASGGVVDWFHRDNVAVRYMGTDVAGNPWVMAITFYIQGPQRVVEIWRVRSPGQADLILSGQQVSRVSTDSHGTWFANETGVYLYSGGRVQRVSAASVGEVVGPCI